MEPHLNGYLTKKHCVTVCVTKGKQTTCLDVVKDNPDLSRLMKSHKPSAAVQNDKIVFYILCFVVLAFFILMYAEFRYLRRVGSWI